MTSSELTLSVRDVPEESRIDHLLRSIDNVLRRLATNWWVILFLFIVNLIGSLLGLQIAFLGHIGPKAILGIPPFAPTIPVISWVLLIFVPDCELYSLLFAFYLFCQNQEKIQSWAVNRHPYIERILTSVFKRRDWLALITLIGLVKAGTWYYAMAVLFKINQPPLYLMFEWVSIVSHTALLVQVLLLLPWLVPAIRRGFSFTALLAVWGWTFTHDLANLLTPAMVLWPMTVYDPTALFSFLPWLTGWPFSLAIFLLVDLAFLILYILLFMMNRSRTDPDRPNTV